MRIVKIVVAWIILSLFLQTSTLFVLDKFIFEQSSEFKSKKIELDKPYEDKFNIKIPNYAENIKISFNGKYISYDKNRDLNIVETKTGTEKNLVTEDNGEIMYYEWLPERERIVIIEKVEKKGKEIIQLLTYNPKNFETSYVTELCKFEDGMNVRCITESVFTSVYYIYISNSDINDRCYRVDINNDKFDVNLKCGSFGNMKVIPHTDRLVYDDLASNTIFVTSPDKKLKFKTNNNLRLIGIDRNDVIYVGQEKENKIFSIFYGKIDNDVDTWNTVNLDFPVDLENIFFNDESDIIVNNSLEGKVKNITTGNEYEYVGKFIDVKDDFIALDDGDKLVFQKFS